ncbi:MAG: 1-acyl-sn-glycerol-3-phosphate acyltransferase [Proteobacteria bacterium]|nr:1-acyl-sn-glycerol-3-phosphate acyltransferase [Pseudomonadota bacterium]MCH8162995.1 1-acyl-sn-glycerol-3-phosphate acyltransferase [Pseudomonadota bacterium]MCH8976641.1 1-acyl-sn-glycerol-3-phosphate acyltransferase [Pseudomonadota bacterium]
MLLRSLLFYMGLISSTMFIVPFCLLISPLPFPKRYYFVTRWTAFNLWWLKITCDLKHSIEGLENIPANTSIIMSKHQSAWETLAIQLIFPTQVWILKRELLWIPVYGWGLASMQPISIDRGSAVTAFRQIVKQGCKRLAEGYWVVIFPEGTRVAPGQTKKYLPGGGMLAEKSGVSIIPIAHNAGYFWPKNSISKKSGTIQMVIGPAIDPKDKTATEITNEVEKWIEDAANKLPKPD